MSEIYERLARCTEHFCFSGDWSFLAVHPSLRRLPQDISPVLSDLRRDFSDGQLAEAGILTGSSTSEPEICAKLQSTSRTFVILRAAAGSTPYDILGPCGSLAGEVVPALAAATDAYTVECLESWRQCLFLAFDVIDLAILRSLGLPVTLAHGLAQLDGSGLRQLLGSPRGTAQGPTSPLGAHCNARHDFWNSVAKIVLVGWSPAALGSKKPRGLPAVASLLGGAKQYFDFDTSKILVWRPVKSQLKQIRLAVRLRDPDLVQQAILHSANSSLRGIEHFADDDETLPPREEFRQTRETLMAELRHEQEQNLLSPWVPKLLGRYCRSFERALVEPFVQEAESADDPIDRVMSMAAADLVQEWHNRSPLITGCGEHASRGRLPWAVPMEPEALMVRMKILARLEGIWRERRR